MNDPKQAMRDQIATLRSSIDSIQAELNASRQRHDRNPAVQELLEEIWASQEAYIKRLQEIVERREARLNAL